MENDENEFEVSPFSGPIRHDGVELRLRIYRFASPDEPWELEVTAPNGCTTTWEQLFERDEDAVEAFRAALREEGIELFLAPAATQH